MRTNGWNEVSSMLHKKGLCYMDLKKGENISIQNEGMVKLSRGTIEITDRKKLEELSE